MLREDSETLNDSLMEKEHEEANFLPLAITRRQRINWRGSLMHAWLRMPLENDSLPRAYVTRCYAVICWWIIMLGASFVCCFKSLRVRISHVAIILFSYEEFRMIFAAIAISCFPIVRGHRFHSTSPILDKCHKEESHYISKLLSRISISDFCD